LKNPPEWFNKLNPAGEVPVLQHDDGRLLNESLIISEYLDAIFPQNSVTPKDAFQKAKHQILIGSVSDILSGFWQVMQKAEGAAVNMDKVFGNFEKSLIDNFFGGKSLHLPLCFSSIKNLLRL
jgi:glutathione S-transferase